MKHHGENPVRNLTPMLPKEKKIINKQIHSNILYATQTQNSQNVPLLFYKYKLCTMHSIYMKIYFMNCTS